MTKETGKDPKQNSKPENESASSGQKKPQVEPSQMVSGALKIFNNFDRQSTQNDKNYLRLLSALISFGVKEVSRIESMVEDEKQRQPAEVVPLHPNKKNLKE
ncbi:MAG: hypothetical protein H7A32_01645 [Deltaproteobacteria bacterium]|nr:hypothetical protein [Deltaproteobacteria bacterium]